MRADILSSRPLHASVLRSEGGGAVPRDGRAVVRVSLVCSSASTIRPYRRPRLDGAAVDEIHTDLSARRGGDGIDLTDGPVSGGERQRLVKGDEKSGPFNVSGDLAREWLRLPANPNGRTNADVLKPWINGMDVTRRSADKQVDRRLVRRAHLSGQAVDRDRSRRRHTFSIVHSRFHEVWSLRLGTSLEDRPRYTPSTTTFKTFPFPPRLTPDIPCQRVCLRPACCGCSPVHHTRKSAAVRRRPEWSVNA